MGAHALTVRLSAAGNPDFGEPRNMGVPTEVIAVSSLREASAACRQYIAKHDLGSGNWTGGAVCRGRAKVARVSYNGRVWDACGGAELSLDAEVA